MCADGSALTAADGSVPLPVDRGGWLRKSLAAVAAAVVAEQSLCVDSECASSSPKFRHHATASPDIRPRKPVVRYLFRAIPRLSRLSVGCSNIPVAGPTAKQTYQLFAAEWKGAAARPLQPTSRSSLADLNCPALRWPPPAPCSWLCWRCWRPLLPPPPDLRPPPRARCCCCRRLMLSCTFTRVRESCSGSSVTAVQVCCTAGIAGVLPLAADGHDDGRGLASRATASA